MPDQCPQAHGDAPPSDPITGEFSDQIDHLPQEQAVQAELDDRTVPAATINREKEASPPKRVKYSEPYPYAIISLFGDVGSAMSAVVNAIGLTPTVFIAAESDPILRQVVGGQFHLRTDGKWSNPAKNCFAIYLDDVRPLLADHCKVLREAFALAGPHCRWIAIWRHHAKT